MHNMWAPVNAEGMGHYSYTPLAPPPPPPSVPSMSNYSDYGMHSQTSQYPATYTTNVQQMPRDNKGGRGRGGSGRDAHNRTHSMQQNQSSSMPSGLGGPWQQSNYNSSTPSLLNPDYMSYKSSFGGGKSSYSNSNAGYNSGNPGYNSGNPGYNSGGSSGYNSGNPGYNSGNSGYNNGKPSYLGGRSSFQGGKSSFQGGKPSFQGGKRNFNAPPKNKGGLFDMKEEDLSPADATALKRKFLEGMLNIKDGSYPKELLDKLSPLKCELCVAKMNSTMQSKMHYSGKQHEKKVRMFMTAWNLAHGEPAPKRAKEDEAEGAAEGTTADKPAETEKTETSDSKNVSLYCECCDLSFTSALHAEQHYMGRNHQKVLQGHAPNKANYFNPETGKWQRQPLTTKAGEDPTGRFGIGTAFAPEPTAEEKAAAEALSKKGRFYCELCNVGATSQEQLDTHLNGGKHKRMLAGGGKKQQQQDSEQPMQVDQTTPATTEFETQNAGNATGAKDQAAGNNKSGKDLSFFRTPSGKYYCQPCNLSLNSETQFISHTESKKHKMRQASQKPAMVLTGPRAAQWGDKAPTTTTATSTTNTTTA